MLAGVPAHGATRKPAPAIWTLMQTSSVTWKARTVYRHRWLVPFDRLRNRACVPLGQGILLALFKRVSASCGFPGGRLSPARTGRKCLSWNCSVYGGVSFVLRPIWCHTAPKPRKEWRLAVRAFGPERSSSLRRSTRAQDLWDPGGCKSYLSGWVAPREDDCMRAHQKRLGSDMKQADWEH